ncbi:hypothetical protein [Pinibacter soli]|uniref:DUF4397 domain-containing protein n=1 Tax=Pinibacter soli TaxID=3044211 RepID=A0ABT6RF93_9BACT|nr:hypothetical protein [Pinibacter soli]MDI3321193.1 hypothetical protein [Pinibacter soli]
MKHFLVLAFVALPITMHAQTPIARGVTIASDSTIKVIYRNKLKPVTQTAYYLNGTFFGSSMPSINPNTIESIDVLHADTINGIQYNGKILIKTKVSYTPKPITLNELKFKYTNITDNPVVFMIDGDIINADYDKYLIDENNVLQIIVDEINNPKEKLQLEFVKVLTKTEENIKKSKEIRIRGNEVTSNK